MRYLQSIGRAATLVVNGQEAIDALHRQPYDLIFMDVQMPVLDVSRHPRSAKPRRKAIPTLPPKLSIVAMTANALTGDREIYSVDGMDRDYSIEEPTPEAVSAVIEKYLRHFLRGLTLATVRRLVPVQTRPDGPSCGTWALGFCLTRTHMGKLPQHTPTAATHCPHKGMRAVVAFLHLYRVPS
jgi:CheY-like chemotaxis protein